MDWNDKDRLEFPFDVSVVHEVHVNNTQSLVSVFLTPTYPSNPNFVLCNKTDGEILAAWPYNEVNYLDEYVKEKPKGYYLVVNPTLLKSDGINIPVESIAEYILLTEHLSRAEEEVMNFPEDQIYIVTPIEGY